jgi:hypothetical protein
MKLHPCTWIAAALLTACGSPKQDQLTTSDSTVAATASTPEENTLTDAEKSQGWKLLFNGTSMDGWRTYKNLENDSWEIAEGALHCKAFNDNAENKRADLITTEQFDNYEFTFDYKLSAQANSGIIYRVTEEFNQPYESGPEFQLIDDEGAPGELQKWQMSGACYDMFVPGAERKLNPAGTWNSGKLVVDGNHVEHWLNGVKVVEYELQSEEWKKRKATSKWKDASGYGLAKKGHIDLQDHGNEVWFRNLKVRAL